MIGIVDYNVGNLQSAINAFSKIGANARLEKEPEKLKKYDKLVLPGVGAYGDAMQSLEQTGMGQATLEYAKSGKCILGICLGMQLLFEKSYEFGETNGLGLIKGEVVEFDKAKFESSLKVPHMGWNSLKITKKTPLFSGLEDEFYLYFVHSFHVNCDEKYIIGKTNYGYEFASAVQKENIFGFQPHPEKSHENGLKILSNFIKL
ncbi:MAG: imidazole glycerol phosphate synthase subunit HisH [Proteobacteria bacterium]|nr:MAG: imidazole glycerol phosphate synthase subunit HisH [Pseudomonadota bacterium]